MFRYFQGKNMQNKPIETFIIVLLLIFFGCVDTPKYRTKGPPQRKPQLKWKIGDQTILESTVGVASYYGAKFAGRPTANGEIFNPSAMTAAHKTYPFGTKIRVVNLKNNKSVIVRINDRGPFVKGRIIDLSRGAAEEIGMIVDGIARVRLEILEWGTP